MLNYTTDSRLSADHVSDERLMRGLLGRLIAASPQVTRLYEQETACLPPEVRDRLGKAVFQHSAEPDLVRLLTPAPNQSRGLLTSDELLTQVWPDPVWIIPQILPSGLTILAGAPKVGKSWLALQLAQAVAAGGRTFDQSITQGPVMYLALEDPPRRLQSRMQNQRWPIGLKANFLPLGIFMDDYGDLRNGGSEKLAAQIAAHGYRLVVIDTLSRAISGDQNDVAEMTQWLSPLQELAHSNNVGILVVDHHRKLGSGEHDAIADILGSTAKSAMADTIIGLYRESGKPGARLAITGRDVEQRTLNIFFDPQSSSWLLDKGAEMPSDLACELLEVLGQLGASTCTNIGLACSPVRRRGTVYKQLAQLERHGLVRKTGDLWYVAPEQTDDTP